MLNIKQKQMITEQLLCNKNWTFEEFASLLQKKQVFKCLQKHHLVVMVINNNNNKYVNVIKPNTSFILPIQQCICQHISKQPSHYNQQCRIFIHSHGIKGYVYDILNYFTETDFVQSMTDKDICIFTNTGSRLPWDLTTKRHYKNIIQQQANIINMIVNTITQTHRNIHLIMSGFSKGCCVNTDLLKYIHNDTPQHIQQLTIIEEAIPVIKYILDNICVRYKKLADIINAKNITPNIRIVLFPAEPSNTYLQKHHPIKATHKVIKMLNQDITTQSKLQQCICVLPKTYPHSSIVNNDGSFVKFIPDNNKTLLDINYCPQQKKIW